MIQIIVDHIFYEVKARSKGYRREIRWFSFKSPDKTRMEPSPESYGMFQVLSASLETVAKYFGTGTELMTDLTCRISRKLDEFLIVDVVLENKFRYYYYYYRGAPIQAVQWCTNLGAIVDWKT